MKKAFTLVELIFVIVIIGVLAAVAIPKFSNLSDNAKISAELSTASAVQSAIDAVHAEWITNRCTDWTWGVDDQPYSDADVDVGLNNQGYPKDLDNNDVPLRFVIKNPQNWEKILNDDGNGISQYRGPASSEISARNPDVANKPDGNDYWEYNANNGSFTLIDN